jgi:hypothetical protein
MNDQTVKKPENKANVKPKMTKPVTSQEKVIYQLQLDIENLSRTLKDFQQKQDRQAMIVTIPIQLLHEVDAYLLKASGIMDRTVSLSELICDALDIYLCAEKENERLEEERRLAELEKDKKK